MTQITTLGCPELTQVRGDGNTTRQCDYAIQKLFRGFTVQVVDHYQLGRCASANMFLWRMVLDRLEDFNLKYKKITVSKDSMRNTITLIKE